MNNKINYFTSLLLVFFSVGYFIYGFIIGENSAGAGGYTGDFKFTWTNLQIYLNNDLASAIQSQDYYSNRSPLAYIIHKFFNPFTDNQFNFRLSVFFVSLFIPVLLFLTLVLKYKEVNIFILLVLSSIIFFSPYVRTSGYWALEENYGLISTLAACIFYNLFLNKKNNKILYLTFVIFFSSCSIYFDIKFLIFPLIIFIKIFFSKENKAYKLYMLLLYFVFSIPYLFLIYIWGGIFSPKASKTHSLESGLYLDHLVYVFPIVSLYILPFIFLRTKNIFSEIKENLFKNFNIAIIALFLLILIYTVFFYTPIELDYHSNIGKGFIFKIGSIFLKEQLFQNIFFIVCSLVSLVILLIYLKKNINDWMIVFYYILLSLVTYPLLQEYFDPLIFLMVIIFFNTKINFNYRSVYFLYSYFLLMNFFAKFYYSFLINISL